MKARRKVFPYGNFRHFKLAGSPFMYRSLLTRPAPCYSHTVSISIICFVTATCPTVAGPSQAFCQHKIAPKPSIDTKTKTTLIYNWEMSVYNFVRPHNNLIEVSCVYRQCLRPRFGTVPQNRPRPLPHPSKFFMR